MTLPASKVFETEYRGNKTTVYADENGLRVQCAAGDLLIVDWHAWLLSSVFSINFMDPKTGPFQAVAVGALAGFPPPPEDDE